MSYTTKTISFINSRPGVIAVSIIWGIGLAAAFRYICKGRECYIIKPYHIDEILDPLNNWIYNNRCYKYHKKINKCI